MDSRRFRAISGTKTFSSKWPCIPPTVIAASFPMTCAETCVTTSWITGLTLPGMIELPGSFSGIVISPIPQRGPDASQRTSLPIFDSEQAQKDYGWSDEDREAVEQKLLKNKAFMVDYFPAPGEHFPEEAFENAARKPSEAKRRCLQIGYEDGQLVQCINEPTAGRDYCHEHDPETQRIKRGGGTTVG